MDERCETCRFWKIWENFPEDRPPGRCRRFPPVVVANPDLEMAPTDRDKWLSTMSPLTSCSDWCGEYQKGETQ